jgi:hypothetical protein
MTTLINNLTNYVNDDDIGVGFVASILAIVLGGSLFFMYNLLIIRDTSIVQKELPATSQVREVPILPPAPLKLASEPTL